ncbi:cytochrome c-type biogenesis protein [Maritimibacter sp. HL-12]|jgi:cytochrome c-type biogenesis protein CcmH|uniref:cytochrome c-type biogenesis protein n=1 Tax=Maritimibacter sp. HL-12 TaxID=1162418 RepID=UPI000A0F2674|nr:cytochrome c-type biogenesis protein [Maritimibacter sp. HL-12]SMH57579.1 cytochrome c-type biogenesis protein CcmH [Maritimibacter sp. HL-12]
MKKLFLALALIAGPAFAVNPDEVLEDPALEARAREISAELRCVVCQGENIDESNAAIARDLRGIVRERLLEGDSNVQVVDFVVERYGEYVLMKPTTEGANILLWWAGPALFVISLLGAGAYLRRRAASAEPAAKLTSEEQARLDELMKG